MSRGQLYYLPNARHPQQRSEMEALERAELCIFCEEGLTHEEAPEPLITHELGVCHKKQVLLENESWVLLRNEYPYEGTLTHVMLTPRHHVGRMDQLSPGSWVDLGDIWRHSVDLYDLPAYGAWIRNGHPRHTGATIFHLHIQIALRDPEFKGGPMMVWLSSGNPSPDSG